ncbi:hypothetical protein J1614_003620 [Plenodomus biglobosus]|nr:hypothetical protein J1614_003620 [Plenodomus biglobosus]
MVQCSPSEIAHFDGKGTNFRSPARFGEPGPGCCDEAETDITYAEWRLPDQGLVARLRNTNGLPPRCYQLSHTREGAHSRVR